MHNDDGSCPWLAAARAALGDRNGGGSTTGALYNQAGDLLHTPIVSGGTSELIDQSNALLQDPRSGMPYLNPLAKAGYPSAQHPETQFATWMRENRVRNAVAVINNDYVCPRGAGTMGCQQAVAAILPHGYSLTIQFDGGSLTIPGSSQIPLSP